MYVLVCGKLPVMGDREMISVEEALQRVLTTVPSARVEEVGLADAVGRVLARDLQCNCPVPAADNSAMDGFGVRAADVTPGGLLRLIGDSRAGVPFDGTVETGACARVMTGGLIPAGVDAVVPVEHTSGYEPSADGTIEFTRECPAGANIRPRGSVCDQGQLLIGAGSRLGSGDVGVLAHQGRGRVAVGGRPRVAVLPTGDEVVAIASDPGPGQVRNSNAWALVAQVQAAGGEANLLPILDDRVGDTRGALLEALRQHDLVCTIGGVSKGTHDFVRGGFADLGGRTIVESMRVKPGKPTLFGEAEVDGEASFLLGLPGNPASSFAIFELLGAPWVRAFQGAPAPAPRQRGVLDAGGHTMRANWREQVLPARIGANGGRVVAIDQNSSADLFSLARATALFFLKPDTPGNDGDTVEWIALGS